MRESLGMVETVGISTAIQVADVMVKAANVKILELENSRGSGYMTVKVVGDVGAVKAAVMAAKAEGLKCGNLVSASVIARPSDGMASLFCNPKVPYQSVNKKPIPQAWADEHASAQKAKKPEEKKVQSKVEEPKKATTSTSSAAVKAEAKKPEEPKKTVSVTEQKKVETNKAAAKPAVETKAEPAKSTSSDKSSVNKQPQPSTTAKPKPKITSSKKRKK